MTYKVTWDTACLLVITHRAIAKEYADHSALKHTILLEKFGRPKNFSMTNSNKRRG